MPAAGAPILMKKSLHSDLSAGSVQCWSHSDAYGTLPVTWHCQFRVLGSCELKLEVLNHRVRPCAKTEVEVVDALGLGHKSPFPLLVE